MDRYALTKKWIGVVILIAVLLGVGGCLARSTDEETEPSSGLVAGHLSLELFPVDSTGIDGLSYYCRLYYDCGCPILSPDDIEWCREEVWYYSEEDCQAIVTGAVPECITE